MRTAMIKRSGVVLLSAFFILGFASCESDDDEPISDQISQQDRNFSLSSSQFINAQISMSQLALKNGQDDSVLDYSRLILDENSASKIELNAILDSKKIETSEGISPEIQTQINELTLLTGEAFDERYIDFQILNLDNSVSMFENQVDNGLNFTIKGFAEKALAAIKDHKKEAILVRTEIDIENI
jgi:predicted outer membrane protein